MTNLSLVTWRQHSSGALALCKIRGRPRNILERRLYASIRDLMITQRLRDYERIPKDEIDTLWKGWQFDPDPYHYGRLVESSLDIPTLRAKAYELLHRPMDASVALALQAISADAKTLDLRFSTWPNELPFSALERRLFIYKGPLPAHTHLSKMELWPGPIDFYWNPGNTHIWNTYRMHRVFISMIVVNCAERLHPPAELESNADYSNAVQLIRAMVDDICASVPFILHSSRITRENASSVLLGAANLRAEDVDFCAGEIDNLWHINSESSKSGYYSDAHVPVPIFDHSEHHGDADDKGHTWVGLGGLPLIGSLYSALTLFCVPREQRIWIRGRLRVIAESYKLDYAKVLEELGAKAEKQNKLDLKTREGRMPTITDMAPLPWVEWRDGGR
ncbi:hypothetical protein MMC17_005573 [Xylographa soralifera]|nr:hypothetical protein [Xylographa soralifera]